MKIQLKQPGMVGNCKDFISGIYVFPEFDLKYVNLYRSMQPHPLREDAQRAAVENANPHLSSTLADSA